MLEELSIQELSDIFNKEYAEALKGAPAKLPKKKLSAANELRIKEAVLHDPDCRRTRGTGSQLLFHIYKNGIVHHKETKLGINCHAFIGCPTIYPKWSETGEGILQVYRPTRSAKNDDEKEYYRWLANDSPYADFFYDQHEWGDYMIGDMTKPIYSIAASFAMARRFSELYYPSIEETQKFERVLGLSTLPALMYAQLNHGYAPEGQETSITFVGDLGHTLFSSDRFTCSAVLNLLLGRYQNQKLKGRYPFSWMWAAAGKPSSDPPFGGFRGILIDAATKASTEPSKEVPSTPDPFGCLRSNTGSINLTVDGKRKGFLITLIRILRGEYE